LQRSLRFAMLRVRKRALASLEMLDMHQTNDNSAACKSAVMNRSPMADI